MREGRWYRPLQPSQRSRSSKAQNRRSAGSSIAGGKYSLQASPDCLHLAVSCCCKGARSSSKSPEPGPDFGT